MKPLLYKTTKPFLIFVLIVLIISIPVYYFVVDSIWMDELDEHNEIVAEKTVYGFNKMKLSDEEIQRNIDLWNKIQPGTNIEKLTNRHKKENLVFTIEKDKPYSTDNEVERYRCLQKVIYIKDHPYLFTIETNIEEIESTVSSIGIVTFIFFILIVIGLFVLNRRLSTTIWSPFRDTLNKLKNFNIKEQTQIQFADTDTTEFEELNQSLQKLITHHISVYKTQKEFTENASHELQTPLAVLKNKLDILMQSAELTELQYNIAEDMHRALLRSSRINQNLLLLARIENSQFDTSEMIHFDEFVKQSIDQLQEYADQKNITLEVGTLQNTVVSGNTILTEILINNLVLNAIRHTTVSGFIYISLTDSLFSVANSGENELDKTLLFKRFSRQSYHNNGSGLGLAIVKEIARSHQWEVHYNFVNQTHLFSVQL